MKVQIINVLRKGVGHNRLNMMEVQEMQCYFRFTVIALSLGRAENTGSALTDL